MKEYQVSYRGNRLVTKDNIIDVLNELGYNPGSGASGLQLLSITSWYKKTTQSEGVTVDNPENPGPGWQIGFILPDPTNRYVWKFSDYHYGDPDHEEVEGFHIYTNCELVSIYSSPDTSMGIDFVYTLFSKDVIRVTLTDGTGEYPVTAETPLTSWTRDISSLAYGANAYLWMSQKRVGEGQTWSTPIRLSGEDGNPGADGQNIQFSYRHMNRLPDSNSQDSADHPYTPGTSNSEIPDGWHDHPSGVGYFTEVNNNVEEEVFYKYEWATYRLKKEIPQGSVIWEPWSTPFVWSAYGEKGMDGDGVEYVYRREWSGEPGEVDHPSDFIPTIQTPIPETPSSPVFFYGEEEGGEDAIEQAWNGGVYLVSGGNPNNPNDWQPDGWDGDFTRWDSSRGTYDQQGEWIPKWWSDDPKGVNENHKKEYVSSRKRVNGKWGPFSTPSVWATFSKEHTIEIGEDGYWYIDGEKTEVIAEGQNGKGIDLKGKVDFYDLSHESQYMQDNPDFSFPSEYVVTYLKDVDDENSANFRDPEIGDCYVVTYNGHIYLYVGGDDADWTKHWQDFGEFQGEGAYVHIAWAENVTIEGGEIHTTGFVLDKNLSDNIAGLDWMGIYTDNKINDSLDATKYKWNYLRGRDGDNIERVYIRTAVEVTPKIEYTIQPGDVRVYPSYTVDGVQKTYQSQEYLPFVANPVDDNTTTPPTEGCQPDVETYNDSEDKYQFTDDPQGVTSTLPYEWMSERKKRDGEWKYFSIPSLHATYSHNGQSVIRSTIFRRWDSLTTAPTKPLSTFGNYEYPAGNPVDPNWKDGIPPGTGAIWKTERVFTSDGRNPQWDEWSTPTLVQDDDNYDIELSDQPRNSAPTPPVKYDEATIENPCNSHHPEEGDEGYNENLIAENQLWYDPVLDADYITSNNNKINWMATRTKYVDSNGLPKWRPWTIILIKGEDGGTGPAGIGFQHAYIVITGSAVPNIKINPNNSTEFISDAQGATGTWQLDTTNGLTVGLNQYLWMAERTVQSGVYGSWGTPVKISGNGTPGEDAEDIEFVYKQENRLPNNTSQNSDKPGYNTYTDGNGIEQDYDNDDYIPQGWSDNPQGVDLAHKYEWMCQRIKPRTGEIVDPDHPWGEWSNVFVWSAYGDTGMDGDGVEYIFTVDSTLSSSTPASPKYKIGNSNTEYDWAGEVVNTAASGQTPVWKPKGEDQNVNYTWIDGGYNLQGEWIPTGWSDEPHGVGYFTENNVEVLYSYEWVSIRKKISGEWKSFSPPAVWSNYAIPHTYTIDSEGWWVDEDGHRIGRAEGEAGTGIELKDTLDVKFNCNKQSYAQENGIADPTTVKSLQEVHPISFTDTTSQYKDIQPGDCYVVKDTRHLYVCRHSKSNWDFTDNASTINDNTWDANKNWSDVGEFLGKGSYMHIAWAASKDPKPEIQGDNIVFNEGTGTIKWIKYFVTAYENKLPDVDYDWMGVYSDYEQLDPPSNFDLTANDGTTTDGKALNSSLYKWNNVRGRDGDNYERVYVKSKGEGSGNKPQLPSTYESYNDPETGLPVTFQDPEYRPVVANYVEGENPPRFSHTRFTDDPTGVNEDYPYEWMCERKKKLNTTTHQVEWFPFSPPALWAKYSFDGQHGNSVQVAYAIGGSTLTITDKTGNLPISSGVTWYSNTTGLTPGNNQYLWMSQRVGFTGNWGLWEDPIRLSGQDGKPGEDGADIEFIYLRNNNSTAPSSPANPTAKNKSDNRTTPYYGDVEKVGNAWIPKTWDTANNDAWSNWEWYSSAGVWNNDGEWIPTGWSDNPSGVDSTHKYEWACQRTKSSGNNQSWTQWVGPFKWSAYGDTGMDGDGVEYIYYRYQGSGSLQTPSGPKALTDANEHSENGHGIAWNGGVYLSSSPHNPIESDDWLPKDWNISGESWEGWDPNFGYYNQQGEWIPKVGFSNDNNPPSSPTHWSDDPLGVNKDNVREWVSVRKRVNGEWGTFSPPQIWASHGTYVEIIGGYWYIDGVQYGKAEGEDGKGIALKGSVDFLTINERDEYKEQNPDGLSLTDLNKLHALQEIQPGNPYNIGITSVNIGDCYVVRKNRYLYTSKCMFDTDPETTDDWKTTNQDAVYWWDNNGSPGPGQQNWAEVGEFQGADGEGNYVHIAWAPDSSVTRDQGTGEITLITPFIVDYAELNQDVVYEWMGVFSDENENDPVDNYNNSSLGWDPANEDTWNWKKYKWNHVKGRDGSDYERVFIRTKTKDNRPTVDQSGYSNANSGHNDPTQSEFYPKVGNYDSTNFPGRYFTDDPVGVSGEYPYEWITERRKVLNSTTQRMEWGEFNSPATLWATYSFDGMDAHLTRASDSVNIDAAGNVIGGYGSNSSPRIYTEVQIYDPKKNNGDNTFGGYLTFTDGTVGANQFSLTLSDFDNCSASIITSGTYKGKVWVSGITNTGSNYNSSSVKITATLQSGKTFTFDFPIKLTHIPQTYLTYTLTNDSDTFTYRTKTKKYDGLPISTTLDVQTTDGTIDKLNDNDTTVSYVSSTKVEGIGDNNLLKWAKITKKDNTNSNETVNSKTVIVSATTNGTSVTHHKYTVTIYGDSNYSSVTGLILEINSNGLIELKRSELTTDLDLPDNTHNLNITSTAVLNEVTYAGLTKTFKLTEKNDVTLYKLVLSSDSFIESEAGNSYSPLESTFSVSVNIIEESGTSTVSPSDLPNHIKVRYINGAGATSPDSDTLSNTRPEFSTVQNNFFTVLVVEYDGNTPIRYHDAETVDLVPPGVSASYLDLNYDKFYIDCDADGKIIATGNSLVLGVQAYLRKGNLTCLGEDLTTTSITIENVGYSSSNVNYSSSPSSSASVGSDGKVSRTFTFVNGKILTTGRVKVNLAGEFSDGTSKNLTKYIDVIANRKGDTGSPGDFKATAFIRTSTNISSWQPIGLNTSNCPTGFSNGHTPANGGTWSDGIPSGDYQLWASTITVKGDGTTDTNTGWSLPRKMTDTQYYDVEFSDTDINPGDPTSQPAKWFDPGSLGYGDNAGHTYTGDFTDVYWRAEKECRNGVWDSEWTVLRIKGESEPNVKSSISSKYIETDPTGKLSSEYTFSFTTQLFVAGIAQVTTTNTCPNPNNNVVKSIQGGTFNTTNNSITWTVTIKSGVVLSNVDLQITMANSTYTDSLTFPIIFINKNRSKFKSTVFTRTNIDISSTRPTGGDYGSPKPTSTVSMGNGNTNSWYDGIPSGSAIIWASSRTFSSDGQDQDASWSYPREMSDTDTYDVEFSDQDSNTDLGTPATQPSKWFDPKSLKYRDWTASNNHVYTGNWEDVYWRAEKEIKNGEEGNWVVLRIKGETGESQHIVSTTAYYKIFDTLDVTLPPTSANISSWTTTQIQPTKDNPYLWRFYKTVYTNPEQTLHHGLEMIQVWSENMINPNLLDDTDFIPDDIRYGTTTSDHKNAGGRMGEWYTWQFENISYAEGFGKNQQSLNISGTSFGGISSGRYDEDESAWIAVLRQNIYDRALGTSKIIPGNWYTLSFWMLGNGNPLYQKSPLSVKILSRTSAGANTTTSINNSAGKYLDGVWYSVGANTTKYIHENIEGSYGESYDGTFNSTEWKRYSITFKFKDEIPDTAQTIHIEWTLSIPEGLNSGEGSGIYICKPKLELGKIVTDYIAGSATHIRDPYPRMTVWKAGQQYYQGKYGEPYLDAVTYGANWFRCRNTHISSDSNKPVIGQTTAYWEPAQNLDFIVTDLLLAETGYIKNLIVGGLMTGDRGTAHVEMKGSEVYFFGNKQFANIRMSVDADGMAYLQFYDKNNNFLYDLGPRGINWLKTVETPASWSSVVYYRKINDTSSASGLYLENIPLNTYTRKDYYQFSAKLVNGTPVADGTHATTNADAESANGKYFTTASISPTYYATGLHYFVDDTLNKITEFWYMEKYGNTGNEAINELKNDLRYYGFSDDFLEQLTYEVINPDVHKLKYKILVRRFVYFDSGVIKYPYGLYQYRDVADGDPISGFSMTL